ncbi:MAG: PLP-dependent aminotransferase family protein [Rubrivivax sp.]|nr:PLP-dependent aminotransferase family protein [Rubrivivax sp.]
MGQLRAPAVRGSAAPASRRAPGPGRRLYDMLRRQMADGALPAGARVPSTRALAAELGLSRTTVTAVFEQLAAEGFIVTSVGRVARVASQLARAEVPRPGRRVRPAPRLSVFGRRVEKMVLSALPAGDPCRIDFLYGAVAARDFPALSWRRAYQAALLRHQPSLYYAPPEGDATLRRALQGYLSRARGLACDAGQIVIVHGSQQAIDLCARVLLDPDDAFAFEDPGYLMARRCFEATGARLLPVPVDSHGLETARLPEGERVRLVYVTPSHQFPLGGMLPIARRQALLQWAARHRAWIVEDDYDGEFRYGQRPIDALQSIDGNGRVIYVGTFSKALSPQLRLGYLVLPPELVPAFRQAKRLTDRHAPVLEQRALASLIESGAYERHVRRMRRENERRRATLLDSIAQALPADARVAGAAAGLHVVLWLPSLRAQHEPALVAAARERGVGVYPVSPLFAAPPHRARPRPAGLILGYASLTLEQIRQGVQALGTAMARMPVAAATR